MNSTEPVLQEDKNRFVIFPVKHHDIWDWYKEMEACYWTAAEIDLHQDFHDWNNKLSQSERLHIKHILAYFAVSHVAVNQDLSKKTGHEVQYSEARFFYDFQNMTENIHAETFSLLIDTYVKDDKERNNLFRDMNSSPAIGKKVQWALDYLNSESFAERLIAMAIIKRIFSSSGFCSFSWLKHRGLMPGLSFSNELISRDEGAHCDFAVHLHNNHLINKVSKERIREIIIEALNIEKEYILESLPANLIGINAQMMTLYVEFVADALLTNFNCEKEYNTANPFEFMDKAGPQNHRNFLEKRAGAYQKAGITSKEKDTNKINLNTEFNR